MSSIPVASRSGVNSSRVTHRKVTHWGAPRISSFLATDAASARLRRAFNEPLSRSVAPARRGVKNTHGRRATVWDADAVDEGAPSGGALPPKKVTPPKVTPQTRPGGMTIREPTVGKAATAKQLAIEKKASQSKSFATRAAAGIQTTYNIASSITEADIDKGIAIIRFGEMMFAKYAPAAIAEQGIPEAYLAKKKGQFMYVMIRFNDGALYECPVVTNDAYNHMTTHGNAYIYRLGAHIMHESDGEDDPFGENNRFDVEVYPCTTTSGRYHYLAEGYAEYATLDPPEGPKGPAGAKISGNPAPGTLYLVPTKAEIAAFKEAHEAALQEAEQKEAAQKEAEQKAEEQKEAERKGAEREEAEREEAEREEAARREAARREAAERLLPLEPGPIYGPGGRPSAPAPTPGPIYEPAPAPAVYPNGWRG